MKITYSNNLLQGKGWSISFHTKWFRLNLGIGKAKIKPIFYWKWTGFCEKFCKPTTLRHVNFLILGNYCAGISIAIPQKEIKNDE